MADIQQTKDLNPFTMVWWGLWEMVERNPNITNMVSLLNRIKMDNDLADKRNISDADLPELTLLSSGGDCNIMDSSATSKIVRNYTWAIATGEYNISPYYNVLCWELFRAMVDWDQVLCPLIWPLESDPEWHFVVRTNVISIEEGTEMIKTNKGIGGWAGLWQIDVQMHFRTEDLRIIIGSN